MNEGTMEAEREMKTVRSSILTDYAIYFMNASEYMNIMKKIIMESCTEEVEMWNLGVT